MLTKLAAVVAGFVLLGVTTALAAPHGWEEGGDNTPVVVTQIAPPVYVAPAGISQALPSGRAGDRNVDF